MINDLPKEIVSQLSGNCQYVLSILFQLCKTTAKRSPSGAWYCFPSEAWLAYRTGRSRVQISRSIQALKGLGMIDVTHRRKVCGKWKTNLYRLGKQLMFFLNKVKSLKNRLSYRVTSMIHKVTNTMLDKKIKGLKSLLKSRGSPGIEDIIRRLEPKVLNRIEMEG